MLKFDKVDVKKTKEIFKITKTLSVKPSDFLAEAVADMRKVLKMDGYGIDMSDWFSGALENNSVCQVCLGGSVLACRTNLTKNSDFDVETLEKGSKVEQELVYKMYAINSFREGNLQNGLHYLGLHCNHENFSDNIPVVEYDDANTAPFFTSMKEVIKELKKFGY